MQLFLIKENKMKWNKSRYFLRFIQVLIYLIQKLLFCFRPKRGLHYTNRDLVRLSDSIVAKDNRSIKINRRFPASKKISFVTNSNEIKITVLYRRHAVLPHMSITGTSGIDVYSYEDDGYKWMRCISPISCIEMKMERIILFQNGDEKKRVVLFLPSYAEIDYLEIITDKNGNLYEYKESNFKIAIYGSSISQGCAASRPGLTFANILCRNCKVDVINYGFSESAKGQKHIIQHMIDERPCCYIIEYDHNATIDELARTHKNVYLLIRSCDKKSPIIFLSRFSGNISISPDEEEQRIGIIQDTVNFAAQRGDKKVYFINGKNALSDQENCFVDDRHPNDYGMQQIAEQINHILGPLISPKDDI